MRQRHAEYSGGVMTADTPAPHPPALVCARHAVTALTAVADGLDPATGHPGMADETVAELRDVVALLAQAQDQLRRALVRGGDYLGYLDGLGGVRVTDTTAHPVFEHVVMIRLHFTAARRSCGSALHELRNAYTKLADLTDGR